MKTSIIPLLIVTAFLVIAISFVNLSTTTRNYDSPSSNSNLEKYSEEPKQTCEEWGFRSNNQPTSTVSSRYCKKWKSNN